MIYIGNHVSISKGYEAMGSHELELGGNTFAFFPRNPRGGKSKAAAPDDITALRKLMRENDFGPLVIHGAYTMNLCSDKEEVRENSAEMLRDDLIRMQDLPGNFYNFHPGSHTGQGTEAGIGCISEVLCRVIDEVENISGMPLRNRILLETMTGKGSEIGGSFEELREIIDRTAASGGEAYRDKLGVCLDTCHVWDAGYDIRDAPDDVLKEFDRIIGLENLCALHLNDSKNERGARKDRHEKLGMGKIGMEALRTAVRHPLLQGLPFILETPNEDDGYKAEIALVRTWILPA